MNARNPSVEAGPHPFQGAHAIQLKGLWPQVLVALCIIETFLKLLQGTRAPLTNHHDPIEAPGTGVPRSISGRVKLKPATSSTSLRDRPFC